ncbi:MAG TPA: hydantoinase/oxoprolinase family protein [Candidatus Dormibacteraeota bacterium]|nr:hydantoinase/oxoprolinase family protein [Candidatus Dormibacteraeota bacterium]
MTLTVALDIGGTFTDLISFDEATGAIRHAKSSTTPSDLSIGIRECLEKSGLSIGQAESFIHGSTIAINTAIERTGAKTALVVTQGMRDVYRIGRGNRPEAYNIYFKRPIPYVPRHRTFEVRERLGATGEAIVPFDSEQAAQVVERVKASDAEAIAVCFIHSYLNPEHEARMGRLLREAVPETYLSLSHEILREYREYERTSTTVLNAYVGPKVSQYIGNLERLLSSLGFDGHFLIMQSNGGVMSPDTAKRIPVAMMESGPVGGIIAAAAVGAALGFKNVIAFDMGGTTAKASLIENNVPSIAQGYYIGGYASGHPVMLPVVDLVEVGAGGGSIAWIDEVGALKVGPQSAGGHPGPICYGWGGVEPTVTDANVLLGRLDRGRFLGGEMPLDVERARRGVAEKVAGPLRLSVVEAALGIARIAVAKMSLAVRGISVERGFDPRDFALVAFGGAGPLHACEIARELHIPTVVVPRLPAHFSALGMLMADLRHDYVRTYHRALLESDFAQIRSIRSELVAQGKQVLSGEGVRSDRMTFETYLDIRYVGQEFWIQTPVSDAELEMADRALIRRRFDEIHDRRYGHHAADEPVEVVNIRITARGTRDRPAFPRLRVAPGDPLVGHRQVYFDDPSKPVRCPIYDRDLLTPEVEIEGPAIIQEYASTTVLFPGDVARAAETGEIIVSIKSAG